MNLRGHSQLISPPMYELKHPIREGRHAYFSEAMVVDRAAHQSLDSSAQCASGFVLCRPVHTHYGLCDSCISWLRADIISAR